MYAYYQQMLPDLIEQDDRTQLDRYLTIYRQAFPETEQMKDVLTAWDQICDDQKKMDELDKKYRSDYSGGMSGASRAVQGVCVRALAMSGDTLFRFFERFEQLV